MVYYGEIGGVMEAEAAERIKGGECRKRLVAYIAGRSLQAGMRFSHAIAIIGGGKAPPRTS